MGKDVHGCYGFGMCIAEGVDGTALDHDTMGLRFIYCISCEPTNIKAK